MPSIQYINQGRGGTVVYSDEQSSIRFYFEFGGGECVAIIFIPTEKEWEQSTGRSVKDRSAIIQWVAEQALRDQLSNGYFRLSDACIELFKK